MFLVGTAVEKINVFSGQVYLLLLKGGNVTRSYELLPSCEMLSKS